MRNASRSSDLAAERVAIALAAQLRRQPLACFLRAAAAGGLVLAAALVGGWLLAR
jgi:hypothetical protein